MYFFLIFTLAFGLRLLPEMGCILPLGQDSGNYCKNAKMTMVLWNHGMFNLYPLLDNFLALLYCLRIDIVQLMKILPAVLYGVLHIMVFVYFQNALEFSKKRSFLGTILLMVMITHLTVSIQLHSQILGTIILFSILASLGSLRTSQRGPKFFAIMLVGGVLISITHRLMAAVYAFILIWDVFDGILRRVPIRSRFPSIFAFMVTATTIYLGYWITPEIWKLPLQDLIIISNLWGRDIWWSLSLFIYSYILLLPFALAGAFYDPAVTSILVFSILGLSSNLLGFSFFAPPERFIWPMVYPLVTYASRSIWSEESSKKVQRIWMKNIDFSGKNATKIVRIKKKYSSILAFLLIAGSFFYTLNTAGFLQQPPLFEQSPLRAFSSMDWCGVPNNEADNLLKTIAYFNNVSETDSALITYYPTYGWTYFYSIRQVVSWNEKGEDMIYSVVEKNDKLHLIIAMSLKDAIEKLIGIGFKDVYILSWKSNPKQSYIVIVRNGDIALYAINPKYALRNLGFETGTLMGWYNEGVGTIFVQSEVVYNGSYAARVIPSSGLCRLMTDGFFSCSPGQRIEFSCMIKADENITYSYLSLDFYDAEGRWIKSASGSNLGDNYDWKSAVFSVIAPEMASSFQVSIVFGSDSLLGNGFIDSAQVAEIHE